MNPTPLPHPVAISIDSLGKCFHIYERPADRLRQFLFPRLQAALGLRRRQYFREFWALREVGLQVRRGEALGILGRNGAGKSTLLQLICGTLSPTRGNVAVRGRVAALLELGAGFNPEFTGTENVFLNAAVLGLTRTEVEHRFDKIVEFAAIGDFIHQPVKTYSSGMFVRLAFAIAAHVEPEILIVDEALSVGDIAFQNKCIARIRELRERGTTLLFVTHDLSTLQLICDRAVWLQDGQIVRVGDPISVSQDYYAQSLADAETSASAVHAKTPVKPTSLPQQTTGLALFTKLQIQDASGHEGNQFWVGHPLLVDFEFQALAPLGECVFSVSIYRSDGDWSVGQTSADVGIFWPALSAGGSHLGTLELGPLSLTPADYKVCLGAYSRDLQICYAMTELTTAFSIRSSYQTWGKFVHPCRWHIGRVPTEVTHV